MATCGFSIVSHSDTSTTQLISILFRILDDNLNCSHLFSISTIKFFEACSEADNTSASCDSKSFYVDVKFPLFKQKNDAIHEKDLISVLKNMVKSEECSCLHLWILLTVVMLESTLLIVQCVVFTWKGKRKIADFILCKSCRNKNDNTMQILEYEMYN